ncbi:6259_t:CDS:10 [Entrophospora sp. SA101]|nr:6259_t:CDS:10 [Entrophospora sp. SA101]
MALETVYAIHSFSAEKGDEISFEYGEPILVFEKDEMYGDGWWQGKNVRGEIGLFPMNYTSYSKPLPPSPKFHRHNKLTYNNNKSNNSNRNSKRDSINFNNYRIPLTNQYNYHSIDGMIDDIQSKSDETSLNNLIEKVSETGGGIKGEKDEQFHPTMWNVEKVCSWLHEKGFDSVMQKNFRDNDITGDILLDLNTDMLKELNIASFGKRVHIMNAITALKSEFSINDKNKEDEKDDSSEYEEQIFVDQKPSSRKLGNRKYSISNPSLSKYPDNNDTNITHEGFQNRSQRSSTAVKFSNDTKKASYPHQATLQKSESKFSNKENSDEKNNKSQRSIFSKMSQLTKSNNNKKTQKSLSMFSPQKKTDKPRTISTGDVLDSIGVPDHEGWLKKQGNKYKVWKSRLCILKDANLYYLKTDKNLNSVIVKGHINLTNYRVIPDENLLYGKYGFKLVHDTNRTHYFAHDDQQSIKEWMKAIMKATISRDVKVPVISSNNIITMPLDEARKMAPRPPPLPPSSPSHFSTFPTQRQPRTNILLASKASSPTLRPESPPLSIRSIKIPYIYDIYL